MGEVRQGVGANLLWAVYSTFSLSIPVFAKSFLAEISVVILVLAQRGGVVTGR